MKQMARGTFFALTLVGLSACVDDPQAKLNNDDFKTLQSFPEVAWIKAGPDSTAMYFRLINDFGYGTPTSMTVSEVTGPITVTHDTLFRKYYTGGDPLDTIPVPYVNGHLHRFFVKKPVPGEGSFKVTAGNGVSTVVRVRIEANDLGNLPTLTALPGQNITLNAPAFQKFAPDAQVTYARGARPANYPTYTPDTAVARAGTTTSAGPVISRAADGSSLTFRAAADLVGKVSVSKTYPTHSGIAPDFTSVALATLDTLKTPGFGTARFVDYTFGNATDTVTTTDGSFKVGGVATAAPEPGQVVTVALGGLAGSLGSVAGTVPMAFLATTRIFIGGIEAGIVHTSPDPSSAGIGADSNSVQILVPAHLTPTAPATSLPVTLTNVALNFDPTYLFGTTAAAVTAVQAGHPGVLKIGVLSSTGNTAPATNYAGTNSRLTAPQLPIIPIFPTTTANIRSIMINDANAFGTGTDCALATFGASVGGCKIYKLNLETSRVIEADLRWASGTSSRLGLFTLQELPSITGAALGTNPATANSNGLNTVVAGSTVTAVNGQYLVIVWYSNLGVQPPWTSLRLTFR